MKKTIISALILAIACGGSALVPSAAFAQYRDWHRDPPPPPPRRHRDNTGAIIAGGLAAGVVGGLIGGALASDHGPRYIDPPPPPPPQCWFEDQRVRNAYDGGWHMENVRVCE